MTNRILRIIAAASCLCAAVAATAQEAVSTSSDFSQSEEGSSFCFSITFTNLGTKKEATRSIEGVPVTFPVDQEDVIDLIEPALSALHNARIEEAKAEAKALVGLAVFEKNYPPAQHRLLAGQVNLLEWAASGTNVEPAAKVQGLSAAHYYFATRALLAATKDHDSDFVARWIAEIRKTNWVRTNADTVIAAYGELTGGDLKAILENAVSAETESAPPAGAASDKETPAP